MSLALPAFSKSSVACFFGNSGLIFRDVTIDNLLARTTTYVYLPYLFTTT